MLMDGRNLQEEREEVGGGVSLGDVAPLKNHAFFLNTLLHSFKEFWRVNGGEVKSEGGVDATLNL